MPASPRGSGKAGSILGLPSYAPSSTPTVCGPLTGAASRDWWDYTYTHPDRSQQSFTAKAWQGDQENSPCLLLRATYCTLQMFGY
ncbi:hypothetical protein WJX82_010869 [Trebouxia sp. C0006]